MSKYVGLLTLFALYVVLIVGGLIGYVLNIMHVHHADVTMTSDFILRIIGIIVPFIGAIMGYIS